MPFKQCACHVFAITGYESDDQMGKVNQHYGNFSVPTGSRVRRPTGWDANEQLQKIIATVREKTGASLSDTKIIIYGGFRSGQLQPEHMWVEHSGMIYDTMPGYDLYATGAKDKTRKCPFLEGISFDRGGETVAKVETLATKTQLENMKAALLQTSDNISNSSQH